MRAPLRPLPRSVRLLSGLAIAAGCVAAGIWLAYQLWRLIELPVAHFGAVDLHHRRSELSAWFLPGGFGDGPIYPPATLFLLRPLVLSPPFAVARWLWALLNLGCLLGLTREAIRLSRAPTRGARALAVLTVLSAYATGASLGNGQLNLIVLCALCAAWRLADVEERGLARDFAVGALLVIALLKPSLSGPLVCALPLLGAWRAGFLGAGLYGLCTAGAYLLRDPGRTYDAGTITAHVAFRATEYTGHGVSLYFVLALSLLALSWLWVWMHRDGDRWRLFALVAMLTHGMMGRYWFDDVLMLFATLLLLRELYTRPFQHRGTRLAALLACALFGLALAPGGRYLLPASWGFHHLLVQQLVWMAAALFLLVRTRQRPGLRA